MMCPLKKIIEFNTLRGPWKMLKNDCDKCQNLEFSFEQLNEIPTLDRLNKSPLHVWFIRECVRFTTTFELMNQIPCRSTNNKIQVKQKIMSAKFFLFLTSRQLSCSAEHKKLAAVS